MSNSFKDLPWKVKLSQNVNQTASVVVTDGCNEHHIKGKEASQYLINSHQGKVSNAPMVTFNGGELRQLFCEGNEDNTMNLRATRRNIRQMCQNMTTTANAHVDDLWDMDW